MKKSLKVLILVFMLFVLSGCTTDCSLEINEDNAFNFTIEAKESIDYVNSFLMEDDDNGELVKKWLNETLSTYKKEYSDMTISYSTVLSNYVGKATKKSSRIADLSSLKVLKENFSSVNVTNTDSVIDIKMRNLNEELVDQVSYGENKITLNVTLPFVVIDSNASSVNKVDNIYTWNLSSTKKDVILKYDSTQIYEYKPEEVDNPARTKVLIILGCVLGALVLGVIGLSIRSKIKK